MRLHIHIMWDYTLQRRYWGDTKLLLAKVNTRLQIWWSCRPCLDSIGLHQSHSSGGLTSGLFIVICCIFPPPPTWQVSTPEWAYWDKEMRYLDLIKNLLRRSCRHGSSFKRTCCSCRGPGSVPSTCWLTTACNSSLGDLMLLLTSVGTSTNVVHIHTCRLNTHTH